jgi:histidine ammonia-lyase
VSMATFAARRLADMAQNTAGIVAIELLAAAQGVDFRAPRRTSPALQQVMAEIRALVPFYDKDRQFAPDIEAVTRLVAAGTLNAHAAGLLPSEM